MAIQTRGTTLKKGRWTPETPWFTDGKQTQAVWPTWTCRNPSCKSYGKSHPHCACGPPGMREDISQSQTGASYAKGGEIHYCSSMIPHHKSCEHFADGGTVKDNMDVANNPDLSIDHSVVAHGLLHLLTKTGHSKSEDPSRVMENHIDSIHHGKRALENHSKNIFELGKDHKIDQDKKQVASLKDHLEDLKMNPHKLLDLGGTLADTMPEHAGALAAKAASAMTHLEFIKPKGSQMNPMDPVIPPTQAQESHYNRQLAIMENPMLAYQHVKDATISPDDMQTLNVMYPKLLEQMKNKTTEALIDAKTKGQSIPYKQRLGLGSLLGHPLDYTQSPEGAASIAKANVGKTQQPAQIQPQAPKGKGVTGVAMKQINMVDQLTQTPIEASQIAMKKP